MQSGSSPDPMRVARLNDLLGGTTSAFFDESNDILTVLSKSIENIHPEANEFFKVIRLLKAPQEKNSMEANNIKEGAVLPRIPNVWITENLEIKVSGESLGYLDTINKGVPENIGEIPLQLIPQVVTGISDAFAEHLRQKSPNTLVLSDG